MSRLNRREVLEGIGVFYIVASLIFVGLQVSQSQRVGEGQELVGYLELVGNMRTVLIDNADVWHKACAGEELSAGDSTRAAQLYKTYIELSYLASVASRVGVSQDGDDFLVNRVAANLHRYPGFAKLASEQGQWTEEGERAMDDPNIWAFREAIVVRLAELKKIEPNPDYDVMWCGM
jgi:hypothetical protein